MESLVKDYLIVESKDVHFIEQIGIGSYGQVWKGSWRGKGGGTTVAIKKIPMLGVTQKMQNKTLTEVEILSSLNHPQILQIFGACIVQRELWIVMEFIDGGSLFDLLHSELELGWDIRLRLAHQAAISINVLHASDMIHRDLKSQNFLVSNDCTTLKLIDFGLSKCVSTVSTMPRESIGTLRWIAPEILGYPPKWSMKADIYSLGVTFYEIASRKIPFEEAQDFHIIHLVSVQKQRPSIPDDCPKWFEDIITECWSHDATKRPTSTELVNKLEILVARETLSTERKSTHNDSTTNELEVESFCRRIISQLQESLEALPETELTGDESTSHTNLLAEILKSYDTQTAVYSANSIKVKQWRAKLEKKIRSLFKTLTLQNKHGAPTNTTSTYGGLNFNMVANQIVAASAPVWIPDDSAPNCQVCEDEFDFFNRRHHCRACGQVVCRKCSDKKLRISSLDSKNDVRVCSACYVIRRTGGESPRKLHSLSDTETQQDADDEVSTI